VGGSRIPSNPASPVISELEPIRRTKVYEEVADRIRRLIAEGRLKAGDRLPPERELAERFGVSRTSVRDAIRALEMIGLLEPRQGDGTVVLDLSPDALAQPLASILVHNRTLLADLLDVRKMIEPPLAARAATFASPEEIAGLKEILKRQADKAARGELTTAEDSEFHYALARLARNPIALKVLDVLMDLLLESRERSLQVPGRLSKSLQGHRRILDSITRKDARGAEAAMRQHLGEIEDILLQSPTQGRG
jgi:GntR family transcriptional repressor for pyruvate dehydrogenase complex